MKETGQNEEIFKPGMPAPKRIAEHSYPEILLVKPRGIKSAMSKAAIPRPISKPTKRLSTG